LPPFLPQTDESQYFAKHQTVGVDICITPDRLILLDTQPILSSSILTQMIKNENKIPLTSDIVSYEHLNELQSIQLGVFILSVCHVVLIVQDFSTDLDLFKFTRTIEMLKYGIPDVSITSTLSEGQSVETEYFPDIVFVYNKCPSEDNLNYESKLFRTRDIIDRYFPSFASKDSIFLDQTSGDTKEHNRLFFLPINEQLCESSEFVNIFNDSYQVLIEQFKSGILALKKKPFSRSISEKEWLKNAGKTWDIIKKSNFINEYIRKLQKVMR